MHPGLCTSLILILGSLVILFGGLYWARCTDLKCCEKQNKELWAEIEKLKKLQGVPGALADIYRQQAFGVGGICSGLGKVLNNLEQTKKCTATSYCVDVNNRIQERTCQEIWPEAPGVWCSGCLNVADETKEESSIPTPEGADALPNLRSTT